MNEYMDKQISRATWSQLASHGVFPQHVTLVKHKQVLINMEQKYAAALAMKDAKSVARTKRRALLRFARRVLGYHKLTVACSTRRRGLMANREARSSSNSIAASKENEHENGIEERGEGEVLFDIERDIRESLGEHAEVLEEMKRSPCFLKGFQRLCAEESGLDEDGNVDLVQRLHGMLLSCDDELVRSKLEELKSASLCLLGGETRVMLKKLDVEERDVPESLYARLYRLDYKYMVPRGERKGKAKQTRRKLKRRALKTFLKRMQRVQLEESQAEGVGAVREEDIVDVDKETDAEDAADAVESETSDEVLCLGEAVDPETFHPAEGAQAATSHDAVVPGSTWQLLDKTGLNRSLSQLLPVTAKCGIGKPRWTFRNANVASTERLTSAGFKGARYVDMRHSLRYALREREANANAASTERLIKGARYVDMTHSIRCALRETEANVNGASTERLINGARYANMRNSLWCALGEREAWLVSKLNKKILYQWECKAYATKEHKPVERTLETLLRQRRGGSIPARQYFYEGCTVALKNNRVSTFSVE